MSEFGAERRRPGLVVVVAFIATLAGRFTLTRLGIDVPVVNDIRVLLFALLLMSFALEIRYAPPRSGSGGAAVLAVLLLLAYQALSATWAPLGAARAQGIGDLVAIGVLVVVYGLLAQWDRDQVVAVTLTCFYVAAWVYFAAAASGRGHDPSGRWAALGGGPNVFVRIMVLGMLSALYLYLRRGRRVIWLLGVPPFLVGAVASGSRGGIAALFITMAAAVPALFRSTRRDDGRTSRQIGRPLLAVLVMGTLTWAFAGQVVGGFVEERFVGATVQQGYVSGRDVLFREALKLFMQRPFLGTGINGFYAITDLGPGERYVHNLPLAVAAEGGIVGVALLGYAWYRIRRAFARVPRQERTPESRVAAYCGIFVGASSLFSGDYYDARLMWIFLLLAAVSPSPVAAGEPARGDGEQRRGRPAPTRWPP